MRLSIFTKLFLIYTVFTVIPVIITGSLIGFSYEKTIESFFIGERKEMPAEISQELFSVLTKLKIQVILALIIVIFLSLFSSILLARSLTRPLKKIIKGIKEVSRGNLDFIIEIKSKDELGESAVYFNEMTQKLKKARLVLEEAKDTLEVRVAARTRELDKLIKTREETIRQRTRELQDRIDELEIVHRLSVGRELKMIELKKEIEKLKTELPFMEAKVKKRTESSLSNKKL